MTKGETCPSCLRDNCEGGRECYARLCQMQAVAPDMVRLLERLVNGACYRSARSSWVFAEDAKALLSRARGEGRT